MADSGISRIKPKNIIEIITAKKKKNRNKALKKFKAYCLKEGCLIPAVCVGDEFIKCLVNSSDYSNLIANFTHAIMTSGLKYTTVKNYLSAIKNGNLIFIIYAD